LPALGWPPLVHINEPGAATLTHAETAQKIRIPAALPTGCMVLSTLDSRPGTPEHGFVDDPGIIPRLWLALGYPLPLDLPMGLKDAEYRLVREDLLQA
jgi:hypothetical protein